MSKMMRKLMKCSKLESGNILNIPMLNLTTLRLAMVWGYPNVLEADKSCEVFKTGNIFGTGYVFETGNVGF